jgi:hypothetical protein
LETKVCFKCGIEKDISEFYKDISKKDGYSSRCRSCIKECRKLTSKEYYYKNKEKILERNKKYARNNKEKLKENEKKRRLQNPIKNSLENCIIRARINNIPYDSVELLENYLRLNFNIIVCDCCGIKLSYMNEKVSDNSPSIDRIVPGKGYTIGNIALLCNKCNRLKNNATPDELFRIADWYQIKLNNNMNLGEV